MPAPREALADLPPTLSLGAAAAVGIEIPGLADPPPLLLTCSSFDTPLGIFVTVEARGSNGRKVLSRLEVPPEVASREFR